MHSENGGIVSIHVSQSQHSPRKLNLWQQALAVFCGGLIGTAFRAFFSSFQPANALWPWATFLINLVGAFLLGFYFEYLAATGEDHGIRQALRLCFGTGMLGAFTTYGTFILETEQRLASGHARTIIIGIGYALISVIGGLFCAGLGVYLARIAARRTHPVHFQHREQLKMQKAHAEAHSRQVILAGHADDADADANDFSTDQQEDEK
jgi:CrcB protein